jgi:hypothetical protein
LSRLSSQWDTLIISPWLCWRRKPHTPGTPTTPAMLELLTMAPSALPQHLADFVDHRQPQALDVDAEDLVEIRLRFFM